MTDETPVFNAPWHAQVFALTVSLSEGGTFSWPDWTQAFGDTLARHGQARPLDGSDDYYVAWLETLETMLATRGIAGAEALAQMKARWEAAYLATPHGAPVTI